MLIFAKDDRRVVLAADGKEPEVFGHETVVSKLGVKADLVPAFLALTDGPPPTVLTKSQAIALLQRHEDLATIMENLAVVSARQVRNKLATNSAVILERLRKFSPGACRPPLTIDQGALEFEIDTDRNARLLEKHAFHSLVRLLPPPAAVELRTETAARTPGDYHVIATQDDLQRLAATLETSGCCSLDTESSDRDPHSAELFGISFSVKKGEAYYVPVVQSDLKELDRAVVLSTLKKVLEGPVKVVGHNLKYDYVLLRKIGIRIAHFHFDTMLAAHDCFGDWEFLNLPFLAKKLLGKEIPSYKEVVGGKQSILDVLSTPALFAVPIPELFEREFPDRSVPIPCIGRERNAVRALNARIV